MERLLIYGLLILVMAACKKETKVIKERVVVSEKAELNLDSLQLSHYKTLFKNNQEFISQGFDFPVGKPNAHGYYNTQKFKVNNHLGDDWNGVGGGNSDLGHPIYSISNGYIDEVKDYDGGWGNVISIIHLVNNTLYKSLYAHCDTIIAKEHTFIKKGEKIATIGNCNGQYYAHLHLEIRDSISLDIGGGYSKNTDGYLDPTQFIKDNRKTWQK